jgi:hypothetical protein
VDADLRARSVRDAFAAYLRPRLEEDTRRHRELGHVFYQGRWMPEREANRIHYLLKRDSERIFLDLLIFDLMLLLSFGLMVRYGHLFLMRIIS